jgi:McKusick-Kaufman syndrome protein
LFDCSLAGNVNDTWLNYAKTEISDNSRTIEDSVLTSMMEMVDDLIDCGVKLIACQKVIHPTLQRYITRKNLYVIERLSIRHIEAVQKLTGATLLSSFQGNIKDESLGLLASMKLLTIHKKR